MLRPVLLVSVLLSVSACAQGQGTVRPAPPRDATSGPIRPEDVGESPAALTETERTVQETIRQPGVHVVHFWAPWCGNSRAGFESGWYEVAEAHPEVSFTFVTIWNDGDDGAATLRRYGIPETATILAQPDLGPSADRSLRRRTFLGLPLSWTPTTWIFNREGALAYAFNYGEVSAEMLRTAIEHAQDEWHHD